MQGRGRRWDDKRISHRPVYDKFFGKHFPPFPFASGSMSPCYQGLVNFFLINGIVDQAARMMGGARV